MLVLLDEVLEHVAFSLDLVSDREEFVSQVKGDHRVETFDINQLPDNHMLLSVGPHVIIFHPLYIFDTTQVFSFSLNNFF